MPEIASGVFEALIPKAVDLGMSANATLQVFRSMGYHRQTQAFFNLYRQARAASLGVSELALLNRNAYPSRGSMRVGGVLQKYPYQYTIEYSTYDYAAQQEVNGIFTVGSRVPLTKGGILDKGAEVLGKEERYGSGVLTDLKLIGASVRGE